MTSQQDLEKRIERLEKKNRHRPQEDFELTDRQREHIDAIIDSLEDEQRQELEKISARIERSDHEETDSFGLTEAEREYLDVLTGG